MRRWAYRYSEAVTFAIVSVALPSECAQPLSAAPMSRLRLGAPPSFRNPVTPPWRDTRLQLSHVTWDDPYPSPNPIQNPSRRCGYCARAAAAAAHNPASRTATRVAVDMGPSPFGDARGEATSVPTDLSMSPREVCPRTGSSDQRCGQLRHGVVVARRRHELVWRAGKP